MKQQTQSTPCRSIQHYAIIVIVCSTPVCLQQDSGTQVLVLIPPVAGAACAAASTQDAFVEPIKFAAIFLGHGKLLARNPATTSLVITPCIGQQHGSKRNKHTNASEACCCNVEL